MVRMGFNIGKLHIGGNGGGGGAERQAPADAAGFKAPAPGSLAPVPEAAGTVGSSIVSPTLSQELAITGPIQESEPVILTMADGSKIALSTGLEAYLRAQVEGTGDHASFNELKGQLEALGIPPDRVGAVRSHILDRRRAGQIGDKKHG